MMKRNTPEITLYPFFILVVLLPSMAFGQLVTASFDRTMLSRNPSAATTRPFSQMAIFDSFKNSTSEITEGRSDSALVDWEEKIKMNKLGLYFTGHGKFAPELYLSKDTAEKTLQLDQPGAPKQKSKLDLTNNMINIGLKLTYRFAVGIKAFAPSYNYKENVTTTYLDGKSISFNANVKSSVRGLGAGLTYMLRPNIFIGTYYTSIQDKNKTDLNFTDIDGAVERVSIDETLSRKQYGAGISYLKGSQGRATRFEAAYSTMIHPSSLLIKDGEEFYTALEFSFRLITIGANVKFRKHYFYENIELLDYVIGEKTFSDKFTPVYGGFISLGTGKGHTVGVSGMAYKTSGKRPLFGQDQEAKTSLGEITFNYAYVF